MRPVDETGCAERSPRVERLLHLQAYILVLARLQHLGGDRARAPVALWRRGHERALSGPGCGDRPGIGRREGARAPDSAGALERDLLVVACRDRALERVQLLRAAQIGIVERLRPPPAARG